jgi:hypothetical protein
MEKRSVCVWISGESNKMMVAELDKINEGKVRRRSDDIITKSERCSQIIDQHYGIRKAVDIDLDNKLR